MLTQLQPSRAPRLVWAVSIALVVGVTGSSAWAGTWTARAPMPEPRQQAAGGVIAGYLFVVGGATGAGVTTSVEAYDPLLDQWTPRAPMPGGRSLPGSGVIGGRLYVAGGNDGVTGDTSTLQVYEASTDTWTFGASMPSVGIGFAAGVLDGRLHLAGGFHPGCQSLNTLRIYDPVTDTWTFGVPMPTRRDHASGAVIDGRLHVAGGGQSSFCGDPSGIAALTTLEIYDPVTGAWTTGAPMPEPRSTAAAAVIDGLMYVLGGRNSSGPAASTLAYNPATNSWVVDAPIPTARQYPVAATINDVIHVVSGLTAGGPTPVNEAFSAVTHAAIDIKPGSFPNSINLSSAGTVPVAILSSPTVDATAIDPSSVALAGAAVRLIGKGSKHACSAVDVNGDDLMDLVCHVETAQFMLEPGDSTAVLEARTFSGQRIRGEDSIRIVKD